METKRIKGVLSTKKINNHLQEIPLEILRSSWQSIFGTLVCHLE